MELAKEVCEEWETPERSGWATSVQIKEAQDGGSEDCGEEDGVKGKSERRARGVWRCVGGGLM